MQKFLNKIIHGDCIKELSKAEKPFADLIFADPPFNIGYKYDKYDDKVKSKNYIAWTRDWMEACLKVLKPAGSFYIAIGDDYAANIKVIADELGLSMRNWIIWYYTFGQQTKNRFARSHTHIFYFVKDKKKFTFNGKTIRIPSDRQTIYNDKRANPAGKMPDDVWNQYPRICGTFKEREGWHPCQMPEKLLACIIRLSSNKGNWILDPFSGSGTTAVVAAKLNRKYTGIEFSSNYAKESHKRIRRDKDLPIEGEGPKEWTDDLDRELKWLYHENNVPTGQLTLENQKLVVFTTKFNSIVRKTGNQFTPNEILKRLIRIRKSGNLGPLRAKKLK